ncbi:hypothetical protein I7I51_04032 [Histoplasma capsulatum]|uniref:Uncharacterized protein n=1 Tax=Ajellomyces capsulatus TaxID=5037 RepID=A0A8A1M807_AJECA|nr:hypothetical protein I7I51_04032 [Histoplasma capsulatum]
MLSGKGYSCICQNPDSPLEAQRPEPRQHCLVHGRLVRRNPAYIFNLQIRAASHFALVLAPAPASESRSCTPCRLLLCNPVIEVWDGKRRVVASSLDEYYIVYTNEFAEVLSYRTEVKVKGLLKCSKSTSHAASILVIGRLLLVTAIHKPIQEWSRTGLQIVGHSASSADCLVCNVLRPGYVTAPIIRANLHLQHSTNATSATTPLPALTFHPCPTSPATLPIHCSTARRRVKPSLTPALQPVKRTEKPETETAWQTATRGPSQHSTVSDVDER